MPRALLPTCAVLAAFCVPLCSAAPRIIGITPNVLFPDGSAIVSWESSEGAFLPLTLKADGVEDCFFFICGTKEWSLFSSSGSLEITIPGPLTKRVGQVNFVITECFLLFFGCTTSDPFPVTILSPLSLLSSAPSAFVAGSELVVDFSAGQRILAAGVLVELLVKGGAKVCSEIAFAPPVVFSGLCTVSLKPSEEYFFSVSARRGIDISQASDAFSVIPWVAPPATCVFSPETAGVRATLLAQISYAPLETLNALTVDVWNNPATCRLCSQAGLIAAPVRAAVSGFDNGQVYVTKMADGVVVIVFRGSDSVSDFVSDVFVFLAPYTGCGACKVHAGFYRIWSSVSDFVLKQLDNLIPADRIRDTPVLIVGHSLGGAVAGHAAFELKLNGFDVNVMTFGNPRSANDYFATAWGAVVDGGEQFADTFGLSLRGDRAVTEGANSTAALSNADATPRVPPIRPSAALTALAKRACGACGGVTLPSAAALDDATFWALWDANVAGLPIMPAGSRALRGASRSTGWWCGTWRISSFIDIVPDLPQVGMGGFAHYGRQILLALTSPLTPEESVAATGITQLDPSSCNKIFENVQLVCNPTDVKTGLGSGFTYPHFTDYLRRSNYVNGLNGDFILDRTSYYDNIPMQPSTLTGWDYNGESPVAIAYDTALVASWLVENRDVFIARGFVQETHFLAHYAYQLLPPAWIEANSGGQGYFATLVGNIRNQNNPTSPCLGFPDTQGGDYRCYTIPTPPLLTGSNPPIEPELVDPSATDHPRGGKGGSLRSGAQPVAPWSVAAALLAVLAAMRGARA